MIADDAVLVRRGIAELLQARGVEVVAEVGDAAGLHAAVSAHRPDVALVDIRMPPTHTDEGVRAAQRIRRDHPEVAVLLLSQYLDVSLALRLIESNEQGTGYLLKERVTDVTELVDALERVAAGGTVVDPGLVDDLVAEQPRRDGLATLTSRERSVLELVAAGLKDRAIADRLFLGTKTVEAHIASIFRKLDLPSSPHDNRRIHAVLLYLQEQSTRPRD
ncbi:MAG: response regulator transcription factor [Ilumatobacteraceae bacterium]